MNRGTTRVLSLVFCLVLALCACIPSWALAEAASGRDAHDPASLELLEVTFVSPNWEDSPDFNNEWWSRFFAETNSKWTVNFIPSNDYATKYDLILASGDLPDIIMSEDANRPTTVQAIQNGAFWNLTPYLGDFSNYPNLANNPTPNAFKYASFEGQIYAIPRSRPQIDLGVSIRKDWLEKYNLEFPTTLDEYRDTLKVFVDNDASGTGSTIGLVGWGKVGLDCSWDVFRGAFGLYDLAYDSDGGLIHNRVKDEMADYAAYMNELYELGLISQEFSVMKNTQAEDIIISGRAASYGYNIWRDYDYSQKAKVNQPDAEFEVMLPLQGPKGTTNRIEKGNYGFFHISSKVSEEKMLRILDFYEYACQEDMTLKGYYGWEGVHFNYDDAGTRVMTDFGRKEMGTGVQQPLPMIANTWAKVVCVTAPKDYNDAKLERVKAIHSEENRGQMDVFTCIASGTWSQFYPTIESEYEANFVRTVAGQMSVDDYRAYLASVRENPDAKKAFQELKVAFDNMFGGVSPNA